MDFHKQILCIIGITFAMGQMWVSTARPLLDAHTNRMGGYINGDGTWMIKPVFNDVDCFHEGVACVRSNGVRQFIDALGHVQGTIEVQHLMHVSDFNGGFVAIHGMQGHSFVDAKGLLVRDKWFEDASSFSCGRAAVKIGGKWGYIDNNMDLVVTNKYEQALPFSEGVAFVRVDKQWGIIDPDGLFLCPPHFLAVAFEGTRDGLSAVYLDGGWRFVDTHGKQRIPGTFECAFPFCEGLALVTLGKKQGYIDKNGRIIIGCQFEEARSFSEGFAAVKIGDKWGYIDRAGQIAIAPQFDEAGLFKNGFARVDVGFNYAYVDMLGRRCDPRGGD